LPTSPTHDAAPAREATDRLVVVALAVFAAAALIMLAFDGTLARIVGVAGLLTAIAVASVTLASHAAEAERRTE
jgi:hypothetical protein